MIVGFDLDALIEAWSNPLVGLLAARGASWEEARELAQDVFAEAWLGRQNFRGDPVDERAVGAWLAGIARNLHRAAHRRPRALPLEEAPPGVAREAHPEPDLERQHLVRAAIEALPTREREVIQAFYLDETSTSRVAALMDTTERAVEGLLRRARARLHRSLGRAPALTEPE